MIDFLFMLGGAVFAMCISGIINYKKNQWVGLTDEDKQKLAAEQHDWEGLCSAVEAKLKEKNT